MAGAYRLATRQHNERMRAAWVAARLSAYPPAEPRKFLKLDALMVDAEAKVVRRERQSWQAQLAVTSAW